MQACECVSKTQTIWVSSRITTTYQCTFPLSVSLPVIRGQYTDCNLDMTENVLKGGGEGVKTMEFSYLRKERLAKCPLCQTSARCARSVYLHLDSTEQRQERVTCQHTDLEMETGEVKNEGGWGCIWEDFKHCI